MQVAVAVVSTQATHQELAAQAAAQAVELVVILAHWSFQSMLQPTLAAAVAETTTLTAEQAAGRVLSSSLTLMPTLHYPTFLLVLLILIAQHQEQATEFIHSQQEQGR